MAKPALYTISAFDATHDNTFRFLYTSVIAKVNALFYKNSTGELVYGTDVYHYTQKSEYLLPANSLENSSDGYKIELCVYDTEDTQSAYSDTRLFYCKATPVFKFSTIASTDEATVVPTSEYETSVLYHSTDGELLKDYNIYLCDASKNVVSASPTMYEASITYKIQNLKQNGTYYIRAVGETMNGMKIDTGYVEILIVYSDSNGYSMVIANNRYDYGDVLIRSFIVSIDGEPIGDVRYVVDGSDTMVDLTRENSAVIYKKGYSLDNNFSLGIKCVNNNLNKCIIEFSDGSETCKVYSCYRNIDGVNYYYAVFMCGQYVIQSNKITDKGTRFAIYIKRQDELYELRIEKLA